MTTLAQATTARQATRSLANRAQGVWSAGVEKRLKAAAIAIGTASGIGLALDSPCPETPSGCQRDERSSRAIALAARLACLAA